MWRWVLPALSGAVIAAILLIINVTDEPDATPLATPVTEFEESFATAEVTIAGEMAQVRGLRTQTETQISFALPPGVLMVTQPAIVVDGQETRPVSTHEAGDSLVASFPPTPGGQPVNVRLGSFAVSDGANSLALMVATGELLERAQGAMTFEVPSEVLLRAPADLVRGGEQGKYGRRKWVALVLRGSWHPGPGHPAVFDASGRRLELAHVQVGYEKDVSETVQRGTTSIGFFVDGDVDLSWTTLLLGASSTIDGTVLDVTLTPAEDDR